MNLVKLITIR